MNTKANEVLDNIRKTLEATLNGTNDSETSLTEAEVQFCDEGLNFIQNAQYKLEGFEEVGPDEVIEALEQVAADDPRLAAQIEQLFKKHGVVEVAA